MKKDRIVQYYIVNKDLNMSVGKIAAQVAHVALHITDTSSTLYEEWMNTGHTKIILGGHQKDLEKLVNLGYYGIHDLGLTEVAPNSLTCVGIDAIYKSETPKEIKRLQLL